MDNPVLTRIVLNHNFASYHTSIAQGNDDTLELKEPFPFIKGNNLDGNLVEAGKHTLVCDLYHDGNEEILSLDLVDENGDPVKNPITIFPRQSMRGLYFAHKSFLLNDPAALAQFIKAAGLPANVDTQKIIESEEADFRVRVEQWFNEPEAGLPNEHWMKDLFEQLSAGVTDYMVQNDPTSQPPPPKPKGLN